MGAELYAEYSVGRISRKGWPPFFDVPGVKRWKSGGNRENGSGFSEKKNGKSGLYGKICGEKVGRRAEMEG